jgi:hypothetical protein
MTEAIRAWMRVWDRRQLGLQRRLDAWRNGWRACEVQLCNAYEAGYADGAMALKRAQHDTVALLRDELAIAAADETRWGPGGRERFGGPRPGDHQGGPVAPW